MQRKTGGFIMLDSVAYDVQIEPALQPLRGEVLTTARADWTFQLRGFGEVTRYFLTLGSSTLAPSHIYPGNGQEEGQREGHQGHLPNIAKRFLTMLISRAGHTHQRSQHRSQLCSLISNFHSR